MFLVQNSFILKKLETNDKTLYIKNGVLKSTPLNNHCLSQVSLYPFGSMLSQFY